MTKEDNQKLYLKAKQILTQKLPLTKGSFIDEVKRIHQKKRKILSLVRKHGSPFYYFDKEELSRNIINVKETFKKYFLQAELHYAMKSNPHHFLLKEMVENKIGLDASSLQELRKALEFKTNSIIFTGPAKSIEELELTIRERRRVLLHIDSFSELKRLGELSNKRKRYVKCGVRVSASVHGLWNKFGIPLHRLTSFWKEASKYEYLNLVGIQSHMSFNVNADSYVAFIKDLGEHIKRSPHKLRAQLSLIDLGGGFLPYKKEAVYAWEEPKGKIIQAIEEYHDEVKPFPSYYVQPSISLDQYVKQIREATKKYLDPHISASYSFEPGRILSYPSMHLVMKIQDVKSSQLGITDAGTNMVGWEKFEYEYAPVINITNLSLTEKKFILFGSLCTPHDLWGHYMFAKKIKEGDVIVVPNQGAYVYTFAQNFIKPIPPVYAP